MRALLHRLRTHVLSRWYVYLALLFILVVAFVLRFALFDHPLVANAGEGLRDLFVAQHALTYGEWPISGYQNSLSTMDNSPLYYYVVILLAAFNPTLLSTGIAFILLTCLTILGVFFLTRGLFGDGAGLCAAGFLAIAPGFIENAATFVWPPYTVASFVIASFLALFSASRARRPVLLVVSAMCMVGAVAIHQSALPMLLLYGVLALYVFREQSYSAKQILMVPLVAGATFVALFLPSFLALGEQTFVWGRRLHTFFSVSTAEALHRTAQQIPYAFGILRSFVDTNKLADTKDIIFAIALLVVGAWFFLSHHVSKKHKVLPVILFAGFILQVVITIALDAEGVPRHFEPAFWMVASILGVLIAKPISARAPAGVVVCALTMGVMVISGAVTDTRTVHAYGNIPAFDRPNERLVEDASSAISHTVQKLLMSEDIPDYGHFNVYALGNTHVEISSYIFWIPLEKKLGVILEQGPDTIMRAKHLYRSEDYLFLICMKRTSQYSVERCKEDFAVDRPNHELLETVFESEQLSVFLTKNRLYSAEEWKKPR